jgi:hypothetical protein
MDGWMDGWVTRRMDGQMNTQCSLVTLRKSTRKLHPWFIWEWCSVLCHCSLLLPDNQHADSSLSSED